MTGEKARALVMRPDPKPDESLAGYLVRLTDENRYDSPAWILSLCETRNAVLSVKTVPVLEEAVDLGRLALLTRKDENTLRALTHAWVSNPEEEPRVRLLGAELSPVMLRSRFTCVCPSCLREENYIRKIWEVALVTACPRHDCWLIESCPSCGRGLSRLRARVAECACGYDVREAEAKAASPATVAFARRVYSLCKVLPEGEPDGQDALFGPLANAELEVLLQSVLLIFWQQVGRGDHLRPRKTLLSSPLEALGAGVEQALAVFARWPDGFFELLEDVRDVRRQGDGRFITGLQRDFGNFHKVLRAQTDESRFGFLRDAYEQYLTQEWSGGSTVKRCQCVSDEAARQRTWLPATEVARRLGIARHWVVRLVESGRLRGKLEPTGKTRMCMVEESSVEEFAEALRAALPLAEAAKRLGVGEAAVLELVKAGCLEAFRGPTIDGFPTWSFASVQLDDLVTRVTQQCRAAGSVATFTLHQTVRKLGRSSLRGIGGVVGAVLDGDLIPQQMASRGRGLARLLFAQEEILGLVGAHFDRRRGGLSVVQAADQLGVKQQVAYHWVRRSLLPGVQSVQGARRIWTIAAEAVETFARTYVFGPELAQWVGVAPSHVARHLREAGVPPVSGPGVDGGRQFLFRRVDVEHLCGNRDALPG